MIKLKWPSWATGWIVFTSMLLVLSIGTGIYQPQGLPLWMDKLCKMLPNLIVLSVAAGGFALKNYYHRDWLRVKQANGQECPGCRYPGSVEVGGKCPECGMDFTTDIVERWRQWWSADRMPDSPNREVWDKMTKEFLLRPFHKLRQTRFFSSRSNPTPNPQPPNPPTPQPPNPQILTPTPPRSERQQDGGLTAHSPRSNRRSRILRHRPLYNARRRAPRAYNPCRSDAIDPRRPGHNS